MKKHFKLTDETRKRNGTTLHRIQAIVDLPEHGVKSGNIGGWVEKESNLQDRAWVFHDAIVRDEAIVAGEAVVKHQAVVRGEADVTENAVVMEHAYVGGGATVFGNAIVRDNTEITGDVMIYGKTVVQDSSVISQNAEISQNAKIKGTADISGSAEINGSAEVINSNIGGSTVVTGTAKISGSSVDILGGRIGDDAEIQYQGHFLFINSTPLNTSTLTMYRLKDNTPMIKIPAINFAGSIDELANLPESKHFLYWGYDEKARKAAAEEIKYLAQYMRARVGSW